MLSRFVLFFDMRKQLVSLLTACGEICILIYKIETKSENILLSNKHFFLPTCFLTLLRASKIVKYEEKKYSQMSKDVCLFTAYSCFLFIFKLYEAISDQILGTLHGGSFCKNFAHFSGNEKGKKMVLKWPKRAKKGS